MRIKQSFFFVLTVAAAVFGAAQAHAGLYEFINDTFTFREDQKDRVAPNRTLPPKIIVTPSFNVDDQRAWNRYYTQQGLEPVDNLNGSSSKVMRRVDISASQRQNFVPSQQPNRVVSSQAVSAGQGRYAVPAHPQAYSHSSHPSQAAPALPRAYVGEPNVSRAAMAEQPTKIGNPVRSWKDQPGGLSITARPGDYDYEAQRVQQHPAPKIEVVPAKRLSSLADTTGQRVYRPDYNQRGSGLATSGFSNRSSLADGATYRSSGHSMAGRQDVYTVERGDTLSTISDKPQIYNDWAKWPLIWDANRGTVKDPDMIREQQRLGIPRDYTQAQEQDAQRRARNRGGYYSLSDQK